MRSVVIGTLLVSWSSAAHASSPGQPLDCSDWVILKPGIACSTLIPYPCAEDFGCFASYGNTIDNESNGVFINPVTINPSCGAGGANLERWEIVFVRPNGLRSVVAHVTERCLPDGSADEIENVGARFDPITGQLGIGFWNRNSGTGQPAYALGQQKIALAGFTTLFDILQTFVSDSGQLTFRVPYMPEGLPAADHFDTYYGPLVKPIDFSQAHPLQCDYPGSPPAVGDYLAVADTVPTPAPGHGVYYVTAVTHQGQTRYGRKASGGVLSGREPAGLAACTTQENR